MARIVATATAVPKPTQQTFTPESVRYVIIEQQIAANAFPPLWVENQILYRQLLTRELVQALPFWNDSGIGESAGAGTEKGATGLAYPTDGYFPDKEAARRMVRQLGKLAGIGWPLQYRVEACYPELASFEQLCEEYQKILACPLDAQSRERNLNANLARFGSWCEQFRQRYRVRVKLATPTKLGAKEAADMLHNQISEEHLVIEKVFDTPFQHDNLVYALGWLLLTPSHAAFAHYLYSSGLRVYNNWTTTPDAQYVKVKVFSQQEMMYVLEGISTPDEAAELPEIWEKLDDWLISAREQLTQSSSYVPPADTDADGLLDPSGAYLTLSPSAFCQELEATRPTTRALHAHLTATVGRFLELG